jgi:hypothetical protein
MTAADLDTARRTITGLIHQHMPTAAVASGMASAVDPGPWVAWVSGLVRHVDRPRELGLTALTAWLSRMGFAAGVILDPARPIVGLNDSKKLSEKKRLVLADEINRASPRTQSALLEAMQERSISLEGRHTTLSPIFTSTPTWAAPLSMTPWRRQARWQRMLASRRLSISSPMAKRISLVSTTTTHAPRRSQRHCQRDVSATVV